MTPKALIFLLVLAAPAWLAARFAFAGAVGQQRFDRWAILTLLITATMFAAPSFWVAIPIAFMLTFAFGLIDDFKPAYYAILLLALPTVGVWLPGFAGIQNFLFVTPSIVAGFLIIFLSLASMKAHAEKLPKTKVDAIVFGFVGLVCLLSFRNTSFTDGLRETITFCLAALVPYLVFSRYRWDFNSTRMMTILLVTLLLGFAGAAVMEFVTRWHFYANAISDWPEIGELRLYKRRLGYLRSFGTALEPIAFGMSMMVGLNLALALLHKVKPQFLGYLGIGLMGAGILTSLSRAPWLGAGLGYGLFAMTSRRAFSNTVKLGFVGLFVLLGLALTPFGGRIIDLIPVIGAGEEVETFDYRKELLDTGMDLVWEHPLFGSTDFTAQMEHMRQGEGIIDLVNTYLDVALSYGLVGLSLYVLALGLCAWNLRKSIGLARRVAPQFEPYCQAYFAAIVSFMFVIFTTSNKTGQTEELIWMMVGMGVGLRRTVLREAAKAQTAVEAEPTGAPELPDEGRGGEAQEPIDLDKVPAHLRQYVRRNT